MSTLQLVTNLATLAANEGVFDWITGEFSDAGKALTAFASLAATAFFVVRVVQTRMALSALVMAGISAAIFITIFNKMDLFADKVEDEVNSAPAHHATTISDHVDEDLVYAGRL